MGFPTGRARTSGGVDSRWISQMHRYGKLPLSLFMLYRIQRLIDHDNRFLSGPVSLAVIMNIALFLLQ